MTNVNAFQNNFRFSHSENYWKYVTGYGYRICTSFVIYSSTRFMDFSYESMYVVWLMTSSSNMSTSRAFESAYPFSRSISSSNLLTCSVRCLWVSSICNWCSSFTYSTSSSVSVTFFLLTHAFLMVIFKSFTSDANRSTRLTISPVVSISIAKFFESSEFLLVSRSRNFSKSFLTLRKHTNRVRPVFGDRNFQTIFIILRTI